MRATTVDGVTGRVLVLQHLAVEDPGSLGEHLRQAGMELEVIELDEGEQIPPLGQFDFMLVMGGPMDVWQEDQYPWLTAEKAAIRHWVRELERPYLGVCLGHQLLAEATGGAVGPMPAPEIGVMEMSVTPAGRADDTFAALFPLVRGLQWHGAQVIDLPDDGVVLARNEHCETQAIRVGPCAWGVQFHLEVGDTTVFEWSQVPQYRDALAAHGQGDPTWLEHAVALHLGAMKDDAAKLFSGIMRSLTTGLDHGSEPAR